MNQEQEIENAEAITSIFGSWPTFKHSEVISLRLEREGDAPPFLLLELYLFRLEETEARHPAVQDRTLAKLRFENVLLTQLFDFDYGTDFFELIIEVTPPELKADSGGRRHSISFDGAPFSVAEFYCDRIQVASTTPLEVSATGKLLLPRRTALHEAYPATPSSQEDRRDLLTKLIENICRRPAMYVGTASFDKAASFIDGYMSRINQDAKVDESKPISFRQWLATRYWRSHRYARNYGWSTYIELAAATDDERFKLLWELYTEYLEDCQRLESEDQQRNISS